MVSLLTSRSRSLNLLARCVILLFVCSIIAFGQTQQVVLGTQQIEASLDSDNTQMGEAFPVTATASTQINSLSLFLDGSNGAATVWVGLYSSNYGHPNTLLSQAALTRPVSGTWNSVNIPTVQVKAGRRYWVALLGLNGQIAFRDNTGNCYSETSQQTSLTSLPATWRTGSRWSTCVVSMFGSAFSNTSVSLTVSPGTAVLRAAQQQQFAATIIGTPNTAVTWKASAGTMTSDGLYTAPSSAGTYTVTATSAADSSKSASAVVTVANPIQVSISVLPITVSLSTVAQKQFSASVFGSSNTAVSWAASAGTVTSVGLYTAPPVPGTYILTATSSADSSKSASAVVTVSQPIQVSISLSPGAVGLSTMGQKQFTASVLGSTNTAVSWAASGGTVTSGGLYTAPSAPGTYTLTATSSADSTQSASAVVTVSQLVQVSISLSPGAVSLPSAGQQQFTAYVSGTSNTAVTWSASAGTVTTGGLYIAPTAAGTYAIKVISAADPTQSASATVNVSAPQTQTVSVSISPTTVGMPQKWQQQFAANVSGASNTAVVWSIQQGTGTITPSGLYTAPPAVETDIITVTSQADSTKSASANVTIVAPHIVSLDWSPSTSAGISYYKVYRGTVSGGPYALLSNGLTVTSYTDPSVQSGSTYYYVTTAVDTSGRESTYSSLAQAIIPMP